MGDPRRVRPHEVEILVSRELRKAGLELTSLRRDAGALPDGDEYSLELYGTIVHEGTPAGLVVQFRNHSAPVTREDIAALASMSGEPRAADAPKRLIPEGPAATKAGPTLRVMVSTSGYSVDAAREASASGIRLLAIADGPAAFRRSQWSMGQQTPAWVPEYMAEEVDLGPDGMVRHRLLVSGQAKASPRRTSGP